MTIHGGNIYRCAEELGIDESGVLDFSASLNPLGMPSSALAVIRQGLDRYRDYPDPDCRRLTSRISDHLCLDGGSVLCSNGSTELIYLIPRALGLRKVLIHAPAFTEYERACRLAGVRDFRYLRLRPTDDFMLSPDPFINAMQGCDAAFLCNPNNPTGRAVPREDLLEIEGAAKKRRCTLIVDEAFTDFLPGSSVVNEVCRNPYLIVLRSMTKFYGLAGIRLGYGVFHPRTIKKIREHKEPWTVNTVAQHAGINALDDTSYHKKTLALIKKQRSFFEQEFSSLGLKFLRTDANYYLIKTPLAQRIIESLRMKGILVRGCSDFRGLDKTYIRVAVKSAKDNARLMKEMRSICAAL